MKTLNAFWPLVMICILLGVGVACAGSPGDSLLHKSAQLFSGGQGLNLDFEVSARSASTGETSTQKGSLLLGERNKFRLKVAGIEFYSDGVNLWQYNVAQKQVMVKLLSDLQSQFHPSEILFKYQGCKALGLRSETWQGQKVHAVKLDPSRYKGQFKEMEVWLDPKTLAPVRLKTVDNLGNLSWYTVSNIKRIAKPQDSQFVFVAPSGVDEIDMR